MSSTLYVDKIVEKTSAAGVHIPGHVIQVVSGSTTTTQLALLATFADTTGLSASITPTSASSKILILSRPKCQSPRHTIRWLELQPNYIRGSVVVKQT